MARLKKSAKRKIRGKAVPAWGIAGLTLLAGASAALAHPSLDRPTDSRGNKVVLSEEEISDVSLATFYVVDRERQGGARRVRIAMGGGCGCGCGGCGGCWGGNYFGYGPPPLFNDAYAPPAPIRPVPKYRRTYRRTNYR